MNTKPIGPEMNKDPEGAAGIEYILASLHGDPDKYSEYVSINYSNMTYCECIRIIQESMSWPTGAKFRFRYSGLVFNTLSKELMTRPDDWIDDLGEATTLQWLWKNRNYYANAIKYSNKTYAAKMYYQMYNRFRGDESWDEPLDMITAKINANQ